jgi:hypothetical protein
MERVQLAELEYLRGSEAAQRSPAETLRLPLGDAPRPIEERAATTALK